MQKLLLLGSLTNKKDPSKIGGVTVLFELLLDELRNRDIEFDVIDTLKDNYSSSVSAYFSIVFKLLKNIHKYDHVSLQASTNSLILIGPILVPLAKILNKRISMRKFAGDFKEFHLKSRGIKRYIIEYLLENFDVNFFETKYLVKYFKPFNENTYWFPNVRQRVLIPKLPREYTKKFIYIGTVNPEKGIDEICNVVEDLDDSFIVDIYGPIYDDKYSIEYFEKRNISYKGALKHEDVIPTLNKYDVLVLPSYREGYPGILIEAFSLGIPIIATRLDGIMEMITNNKNGLLIDVGSSSQLMNAIKSIDEDCYVKYSSEAFKSFENFDSKIQTDKFLHYINIL